MRPCFVTVIALTGSVGASTLRLRFAGCDYQGDLFHLPIESAAGDVTCELKSGANHATVVDLTH